MPTWSIVVPSFEQGRYLRETLQSLLAQVRVDLEILVEDGGSTDESAAVLADFGERVRWVIEKDGGQADAINKGFHKSKGDYLGYLNSDDLLEPGALAAVSAVFEAHPEVDFVYGDALRIRSDGSEIDLYPVRPFSPTFLQETCFISQPACFWRRSVHDKIGLLDTSLRFSLDYDYWLRGVLAGCRFHYLPELLARARIHSGAKTTAHRASAFAEAFATLRRHYPGYISRRWVLALAQSRAERHLLEKGWTLSGCATFVQAFWSEARKISAEYEYQLHGFDLLRTPLHLFNARRKLFTAPGLK